MPQLIAAALVGKEPARYGMELQVKAPYAYDSVRVPAGTPLAAVASASRVATAEVSELNPHRCHPGKSRKRLVRTHRRKRSGLVAVYRRLWVPVMGRAHSGMTACGLWSCDATSTDRR